ncbi:UNVERIFIED_CONTAM: hypothetical protein Cloal_1718 [Acetivibrio alkalicellulosi]
MSEDLTEKIKQIADLLGNENMSENLTNVLSLLANSAKKEEPPPDTNKATSEGGTKNTEKNKSEDGFDKNIEFIRKVKNIMNDENLVDDPRINLLTAIRPFLNNTRQKKVGDCIKLFQMFHITNLMTDIEKSV